MTKSEIKQWAEVSDRRKGSAACLHLLTQSRPKHGQEQEQEKSHGQGEAQGNKIAICDDIVARGACVCMYEALEERDKGNYITVFV